MADIMAQVRGGGGGGRRRWEEEGKGRGEGRGEGGGIYVKQMIKVAATGFMTEEDLERVREKSFSSS